MSDLQAFLFRSLSANARLEELRETGHVREFHFAAVSTDDRDLLDQFSFETRLQAAQMAPVYELLFCFENSVRELVELRLKESFGLEEWWERGVPDNVRRAAERRQRDEAKMRWHGHRGDSLLNYIDFSQLADIILERWAEFEDLFGTQDFIRNRFDELNLSRRVLAHTGVLSRQDVARMMMYVKDWLAQVG